MWLLLRVTLGAVQVARPGSSRRLGLSLHPSALPGAALITVGRKAAHRRPAVLGPVRIRLRGQRIGSHWLEGFIKGPRGKGCRVSRLCPEPEKWMFLFLF